MGLSVCACLCEVNFSIILILLCISGRNAIEDILFSAILNLKCFKLYG